MEPSSKKQKRFFSFSQDKNETPTLDEDSEVESREKKIIEKANAIYDFRSTMSTNTLESLLVMKQKGGECYN